MLAQAASKVHKAQYSILEAALPGRPVVPAGVLLLDPGADRLHIRLREEWSELADPDDAEVLESLAVDLAAREREQGGERLLALLEDSLSNTLRISERTAAAVGDFSKALARLFERHVLSRRGEEHQIVPFRTHLPLYSLAAAAGKWGEDLAVEPEGWIAAPEDLSLSEDQFVARVVGRSMEPLIPDGSYCIFRGGTIAGSRQNKLLLIWNRATVDSGGRYTVKRYTSRKSLTEEGSPLHEQIRLVPLNPEFEAWDLTPSDFEENYRVIAEFLRVVPVELL